MKEEQQSIDEETPGVVYVAPPEKPLARRLRTALSAARGNVEIRQRLKHLTDEPRQLARIREELGGSHAAIRDLLVIANHTA